MAPPLLRLAEHTSGGGGGGGGGVPLAFGQIYERGGGGPPCVWPNIRARGGGGSPLRLTEYTSGRGLISCSKIQLQLYENNNFINSMYGLAVSNQ